MCSLKHFLQKHFWHSRQRGGGLTWMGLLQVVQIGLAHSLMLEPPLGRAPTRLHPQRLGAALHGNHRYD